MTKDENTGSNAPEGRTPAEATPQGEPGFQTMLDEVQGRTAAPPPASASAASTPRQQKGSLNRQHNKEAPTQDALSEDHLRMLAWTHRLNQVGGTDPTTAQVYSRLPFKRFRADRVRDELTRGKYLAQVTAGPSKLFRLTKLGRETVQAIPDLDALITTGNPATNSSTANAPSLDVAREVPVVEAPRPGGPAPLGPGNPLGSGVRKHRIKYKTPVLVRASLEEVRAMLTVGFSEAAMRGQSSFNWPKYQAGDTTGVGVQVLVASPRFPTAVEATVLWSVEDVVDSTVYGAQWKAIEKLTARRRLLEERMRENLRLAREAEARKPKAQRDARLFASANPDVAFGDFRRTEVSVARVRGGDEVYVSIQGEVALESNAMALHFKERGLSSAETEKMKIDASNGPGEVDFIDDLTSAEDGQRWLEWQTDEVLLGGYERTQGEHRAFGRTLGKGAVDLRSDLQSLVQLQTASMMRDLQRERASAERVDALEVQVRRLAQSVEALLQERQGERPLRPVKEAVDPSVG